MDRNREARRITVNGLSRRRHRTSSLRDSPEEDVPMEFRDRGPKKDRDRSRSKRRRGERREEGGEESSEESMNDEEDEFDDDGGGGAAAMSNHHHRKILPPSGTIKVLRPWKPAEELIGFPVPRKARSALTKRSQECCAFGSGVEGEQINRRNSTSPAPISPPSSSNASHRKKMKPSGPKLRPPKSSTKSSSPNPEELEIEIAERCEIESFVSDLQCNDDNSSSSAAHLSAVGPFLEQFAVQITPKRKRPRLVPDNLGSLSVRQNFISSTAKVELDLPPKTEISSPNTERNPGSAAENGSVSHDFTGSQATPPPSEPPPPPPDSARLETSGSDVDPAKEEPVTSLEKESPVVRPDNDHEAPTQFKANPIISEVERQQEQKFEIDLMAPPSQLRSSSPDREGEINFEAVVEQKPVVPKPDLEMRSMTKDKEDEKAVKSCRAEDVTAEPEQKKAKLIAEQGELEKPVVSKERNIDLQLDLEKLDRDMGTDSSLSGNKSNQPIQKQPPQSEKTAQSSSLPVPMPVATWPGGLPPMGYMAPLQGVVSMDGNTVSPSPIQPLFSHPRPKRCATHSYIARNIHYLQQFMKMNPFWPAAAAGSTPSLFGAKPCNLNLVPSAELHGNSVGRTVNSVQDKGPGLTIFPCHSAKEKSSQATNIADAQRKQQNFASTGFASRSTTYVNLCIFHNFQYTFSDIYHGPAFIFPLNQQQAAAAAAAAASVRPGSVKSPTGGVNVASTNASNSASVSGSPTVPPAATAVSFNYPNAPVSETQYLAILQNNAYPFPMPAVGAPPTYRGTHAQPMPYFNSFYSSQMIYPSQLQQQPLSTQAQNNTVSGVALPTVAMETGTCKASLLQKNRPSQALPSPQQLNQHQAHQVETEVGGEDSPSTADSRISRPTMSVYGQNFPMPIHPQNFTLMTSSPLALAGGGGGGGGGGNQGEKKQQQQPQQQSSKGGVESHPPQPFAMSFASMNGVKPPPGMDISSMAQNNALLQSMPEATRQSNQIIAAARAAQQKKNFRASEEGKTGGGSDSSIVDEEKKNLPGKSITFSRPDLVDSSTSAPPRTTRASMVTVNGPNSQLQAQIQYQQQMIQHQQLAAAARNKTPPTSNGSAYSDHLASSASAGTKFPNGLSSFPQNLVQSTNSSPAQSPQWKNPARTTPSQLGPPLLPSPRVVLVEVLGQSPAPPAGNKGHPIFYIVISAAQELRCGTQPEIIPATAATTATTVTKAATTAFLLSHAYMQPQAPPHSTAGANSAASATSGYYLQRRRSEQPQQSQQPSQGGSSAVSSTGMVSPCPPVTLASTSTSDAKAVVAAASAAAAAAAASNIERQWRLGLTRNNTPFGPVLRERTSTFASRLFLYSHGSFSGSG
ncbi:time for coffee [Actinidia rufa]|uniref:Time for coffee n=1 Tax=Actinidia rufa TaxID=165716 RepID=A0A7J0HFY9_9ERIC|nr:time for coffee [Actinidia rufa]